MSEIGKTLCINELHNLRRWAQAKFYLDGECRSVELNDIEDYIKSRLAFLDGDEKCLVRGCTNKRSEGTEWYHGICGACFNHITTGRVGPTTSFLQQINNKYTEDDLRAAFEAGRPEFLCDDCTEEAFLRFQNILGKEKS